MARETARARQRRAYEASLREHREWVRFLRAHPEAIPPAHRITAPTPEERAASLAQCQAAWAEWTAATERLLDLYHTGAHQPRLC